MKKLSIKFFSKIIVLLLGVLWISAGCDQCNYPKIPKKLSPINWEEYNDVYTVYWNGAKKGWALNGKTVKITGWLYNPDRVEVSGRCLSPYFQLADSPNDKGVSLAAGSEEIIELLKIKFANSDLTKKCYMTGIIRMGTLEFCLRDKYFTTCVEITDIDNIYFE